MKTYAQLPFRLLPADLVAWERCVAAYTRETGDTTPTHIAVLRWLMERVT